MCFSDSRPFTEAIRGKEWPQARRRCAGCYRGRSIIDLVSDYDEIHECGKVKIEKSESERVGFLLYLRFDRISSPTFTSNRVIHGVGMSAFNSILRHMLLLASLLGQIVLQSPQYHWKSTIGCQIMSLKVGMRCRIVAGTFWSHLNPLFPRSAVFDYSDRGNPPSFSGGRGTYPHSHSFLPSLPRHPFSKACLQQSQIFIQPCTWFLRDETG